jgi:hypothetical protein
VSADESEADLETARALLSRDRHGVNLEPAAPDPPLELLGALAGFGAVAVGHDVRLSVYVLDTWGRGHDHRKLLETRAKEAGRRVCIAVNGVLLFVGTAASDDGDSRFILNDLCSAFAGRE